MGEGLLPARERASLWCPWGGGGGAMPEGAGEASGKRSEAL